MWPKRKQNIIKPGETAGFGVRLPLNAKVVEIVLQSGDEFGNEYETRATLDLKNRKIIKQEHRVIKKVKELLEGDEPKLVIKEDSINWP